MFFVECFKVFEIDLVLVIIVIIEDKEVIFLCMCDVVKIIIEIYGLNKLYYSLIVYGFILCLIFDFIINFVFCESFVYIVDLL